MAFALLSRSGSKPQGSVKPVPKRKAPGVQQPADARPGFAKPLFQTQTAALPTALSVPLSSGRGRVMQRKCACGGAAGMSGECEECSQMKRLGLQTKLTINEPGDIYEREADRIADQVLSVPAHHAMSGAPPRIQRLASPSAGQTEAAPASVDQVLASPGRPLEPALRQDMEQRFGHDFSHVRVHTGAAAEHSARDVNAHAYTVGHNMVFGASQFAPGTQEGRQLIAHELTHVVQQPTGHAPSAVARQPAKVPPKASKCHTGCAGHWGRDTTCSKFGFQQGVREREPQFVIEVKGKKLKLNPCCNSWPFSVEEFARNKLGLDGAASCTSKHEEEIATVTAGENSVQLLCSDTICENADKCNTSFGESNDSKACSEGTFSREVIELSPKAMEKLSGSQVATLRVSVCYSGSKQDLCPHTGPGKARFPEVEHCLTEGCTPPAGTPRLKDTGWPRS